MRTELSMYFERVIQPELDKLETMMADPKYQTHHDAYDERPRDDSYTLEPGDIDRSGGLYDAHKAYEAEQQRQADATPTNDNEVPF